MTIIAGLLSPEGVVLASDSQAGSFRGVSVKRLDYTKIYSFEFDGATVIVTGAGETPFITRAVEIIEEKASETKFHSPRELADMTEDAMNEIMKRYQVERYRQVMGSAGRAPNADEEGSPFPPMPNFALMLGVTCGGASALYDVYPDGVAGRAEGYTSTGSGSAFAEYLLSRLYRDDLALDEAVRIAVYVIEEVKKIDLHCGGITQVATITSGGKIARKTEEEVRSIVKYLDKYDSALREAWRVIAHGLTNDES